MTLTLYTADPASVPVIGVSPPSWMCAMLLAEKSLEHTVVRLSFTLGEHRTPEMLARNPRGTIPVLVDEGVDAVVHETLAVLSYLECLAPGHLPQARAERARALTRFHEADALKAAGMRALAYLMRTPERARVHKTLAEHGAVLRAELSRWDAYLAEAPFFVGDQPTLADVVVFPYVATFRQLGLSLAPWPHLAAHHERMCEREATARTRPETWGAPAARSPWPAAA